MSDEKLSDERLGEPSNLFLQSKPVLEEQAPFARGWWQRGDAAPLTGTCIGDPDRIGTPGRDAGCAACEVSNVC